MSHPVPGTTLGVVGGGQLGRMLGEAATPLGVSVIVSDPTPDCPASPAVTDQIVGTFDDEQTIQTLAENSDILTYEIELADPDVLERVSNRTDTPVQPHPETLRMIQDKLIQKQTLQDAGIPVPAFRAVESAEEVRDAVAEVGPVMLKARMGGYDGRGNVPVHSQAEADEAFAEIDGPAMVEQWASFDCELAVIGCCGDGERATFPVTETIHEEEILRATVSPARIDDATRTRARTVAQDVLSVLSGRGVYGIELFAVDGEILVNEIAPRPHNSGHWTIEGCHTSQFEQHIRAVLGLPLGTTAQRAPTVSANILGDGDSRRKASIKGVAKLLSRERLAMHWYGKREVYPLRKMGHFTVVGEKEMDTDSLTDENLLTEAMDAVGELSFD